MGGGSVSRERQYARERSQGQKERSVKTVMEAALFLLYVDSKKESRSLFLGLCHVKSEHKEVRHMKTPQSHVWLLEFCPWPAGNPRAPDQFTLRTACHQRLGAKKLLIIVFGGI